ncbi:DUF6515 family protein [Aquimarina algicola]|uniref:Surface layer protein A domain-containing protein n=1 Tax=Aquimarina algicola TaxID=2589995 RepID=A0A504JE32_9FLAO|nr:DUF6515 family protein [Aquimarina algicola]TPN86705.1 hypothetical protein FHK87_03650 [Aquimarina algicola]
MKRLFNIVLPVFMLLGVVTTSCATTVHTRPSNDIVITKIRHPKMIVHNNIKYYRSRGVWYLKNNRGYRKVAAPVGARVKTLPRGSKNVKIRGVKYYRCNGVHYKKSGERYIIVTI